MFARRFHNAVVDLVALGVKHLSGVHISVFEHPILARATQPARTLAVYFANYSRNSGDNRHKSVSADTDRIAHNTKHDPKSTCEQLKSEHLQFLAKYERLKEFLVEEQVAKAEAQNALVDLEVRMVALENEHAKLYSELQRTRRNRDRLREETVLLRNRTKTMKRLNGLVRDAYTQMANAYLEGVADDRLLKRAKKWLER